MSAEARDAVSQSPLLVGLTLRPPLEELRAVSEARIETLRRLGDTAQADEQRRVYELARACLARLLPEEG